jgi:hypothetical protein
MDEETRKQIAAVMLLHGTTEQKLEVLDLYAPELAVLVRQQEGLSRKGTAAEKNDAFRKPMTPEDLQHFVEMYDAGKVEVRRRGPMHCLECGGVMWGRYIGHEDTAAEWIWRCELCGEELFG